ncbi:hypothetical protein [Conexibacter woesei]|uniref:Uncharacterized protein n=1 Tax=Conexibacter woesei (strain DSM 14684 / CCUG 47730 / CIP 108061 / JCM 11494 / NBRC 100937 / ID131577) TaxID=469383 RepID=D3EZU4_CONWI|nr:hypothetical protein [Conexibacter woesei]ADB49920.1 hypothetical protein Cwoe_1492 [Conexibacter woesei DSM 14684]
MSSPNPPARWTLAYDGQRIELESTTAGLGTVSRLFVDGEQVDEQRAKGDRATLTGGGVTVRVRFTWLGGVRECIAVLDAAEGEQAVELAFSPPAGSRAEKLEALARERPALYASRHVAIAAGKLLFGVLGIGALLGLLLPRIPFPSIPSPDVDVDLPSIPLPSIDLPDVTLPGWVEAILSTAKWWAPIVVAIVIAAGEVEKRRRRQENARRRHDGQDPVDADG